MNNYNDCTHPVLDRNLGSSHFWAVRNTATINIFSNALKRTCGHFCCYLFLEMIIGRHKACFSRGRQFLFFPLTWLYQFSLLLTVRLLHILDHTSFLFILAIVVGVHLICISLVFLVSNEVGRLFLFFDWRTSFVNYKFKSLPIFLLSVSLVLIDLKEFFIH